MALHTLNGLSMCSGIGGLELGLARAVGGAYRTVCVVERDIYSASLLAARMQDGAICDAPIWSDVKTFDPEPWSGLVDIIIAGYPCQPFSLAGKRAGERDPRHLWPHISGYIGRLRPTYVFCENVSAHLGMGFDNVCADLGAMGYRIAAGIFTALEVGARHIRKRLFFVAHADSIGGRLRAPPIELLGRPEPNQKTVRQSVFSDHVGSSLAGGKLQKGCGPVVWLPEPKLDRVVDGLPLQLDRNRALGNAVVPQVAEYAWKVLTQALHAQTRTKEQRIWA